MDTSRDRVPGLHYLREYLTSTEQAYFLRVIDQQPWLAALKRRVQHYGYRYEYTRRAVDTAWWLGPLPSWAAPLADRLRRDGWTAQTPDQLILNEYVPGQGIASHVDSACFGETILSLSLGSPCVMVFTQPATRRQVQMLLEPGSLSVLQADARYAWQHGIPARKTDRYQGRKLPRTRRVSLTFRTVLQGAIDAAVPPS